MCGIAGSFQSDWDVDRALDKIAHRGPDGRGVNTWTDSTHGHVRLAIQDPLPRSDQPFIYRGVLLSFVGEVWNWREIRADLERDGYAFETEGDTEVVAALLHEWIRDPAMALRKMEGMFAMAWTESVSGRTWLARDRFGKVPLYVLDQGHQLGGGIRWASERKAFGREAAFAEPVPAGHLWQLSSAPEPYYSLNPAPTSLGDPEGVRMRLARGVRERLQADVPVCCLISGGLDSSAVLALVKEQKPDVVAYTAVYNESSPDLETSRRLCQHLKIPLREVRIDPPDMDALRQAVYAIEVTSKTQVEIATLCLPLAAKIREDGFRVCLSGEGADELFGGYGTLARRATDDDRWRRERMEFLAKMGRSDFMRVNKAFMAHGVECRTPFLHRPLVERVLSLGVKQCPPGKKLLKRAVEDIVPQWVTSRKKLTFQGSAGIADYCEEYLRGTQRKTYNALARELFGGLPRG